MKKFLSVLFLAIGLVMVLNATPKKDKKASSKVSEYIGEYDETMTPENSCVIFMCFNYCDILEFTQINPKCGVDKQTFECKGLNNFIVFKPCKPGAKYMITKMKGNSIGGLVKYFWDMEFKPNQQVFVLDVPDKPGLYCMQYADGEVVASCAEAGKTFEPIEPKLLHETWGALVWKRGEKFFKKKYAGTPWMDEFIKRRDEAFAAEAEKKASSTQN